MSVRLSLEAALRPLAARLGPLVREHEVLRVAGTIHGTDTEKAAAEARHQVLVWAENRSGGRLPPEAWDHQGFEYFAGGRNSLGVRVQSDAADIWAIRADDPDKNVAQRGWTTEVVVGIRPGMRPRFSVRLLASTPEDDLDIEPHSPGLVQQVVASCGLSVEADDLDANPWLVATDTDADALVDRLLDTERALPFVVLSIAEGASLPTVPLLDAAMLGKAMLGLAQVVIVPAEYCWSLTERLGSIRSTFGGAARLYLPGFTETADPYKHRLFLANQLQDDIGRARATRWLRLEAAAESTRRNRLGREVLAFGDIRSASLLARQDRLASEGASEGEQLLAAQATIRALERSLEEERVALAYFDEVQREEAERAEAAELQLRSLTYHAQLLQSRLAELGAADEGEIPPPASWSEFANWCDAEFPGKLLLLPAARRASRDAEFEDLELCGRCMRWLATTYRDGRISGAEGDFIDFAIEPGIRNAACGSDTFEVSWQGRGHAVDWHVKNGGNTREPRRCLRIYYFWDPVTQQVIVADLPGHRRTGAS